MEYLIGWLAGFISATIIGVFGFRASIQQGLITRLGTSRKHIVKVPRKFK